MDNFRKYEALRDAGSGPQEVYLAGRADGLDQITRLRLVRKIFSVSLAEAKEVMIVAEKLAPSLVDHQEKLIPAVEAVLETPLDGRAAEEEKPAVRK